MATKKKAKRAPKKKAAKEKASTGRSDEYEGFEVPAGYKTLDVDNAMPPPHDFKSNPVCEGKVLSIKLVKKGTGTLKKDTRVMALKTAFGDRGVWETATLAPYFDKLKKGQNIFIQHLGMKKIKGRKQSMHMFQVYIK